MKIDPFNFSEYKAYLAERIKIESREKKGYRSELCEHIGCQTSYLSQILNGKPDLTLEQADKLNRFFKHDKDETKIFILMVEFARSGTSDLRNFFQEQLRELRETRFNLQKRLKNMNEVRNEDQQRYYSAWFYSAIHVYMSIPGPQDPQEIAMRFNLSYELVLNVIHFLESSGLIDRKEGRYQMSRKSFHLGRSSEFIQNHHINWRSQSLQSVEKNYVTDLHYSTVIALNKENFTKVKEIFVQAIESSREVFRASPDEEVYSVVLDVFKL